MANTEQGKQISSRNATKHGCCSNETLILPTESLEEFKSLEHTWFRAYDPKEEAETHLVRQLAHADWFFQRATRVVAEIEAELFATNINPLHWDDQQHKTLGRFLRYQTTRSNNVAKQRKAIEDYRKNRAADVTRAATAKHQDEKVAIAKARLETYQEKNKPELSWDEHMEGLRQKSIRMGLISPDTQLR